MNFVWIGPKKCKFRLLTLGPFHSLGQRVRLYIRERESNSLSDYIWFSCNWNPFFLFLDRYRPRRRRPLSKILIKFKLKDAKNWNFYPNCLECRPTRVDRVKSHPSLLAQLSKVDILSRHSVYGIIFHTRTERGTPFSVQLDNTNYFK